MRLTRSQMSLIVKRLSRIGRVMKATRARMSGSPSPAPLTQVVVVVPAAGVALTSCEWP
jgi:hypothetical protein